MPPTESAIERLRERLRLETPIVAIYDSPPGEAFEPMIEAKGRTCCFAFYPYWLRGETLVIRKGTGGFEDADTGCPGAHRAFGLEKEYPDFMAHFLTDGIGAPMGEGLMASPELAQEFLDRAKPVEISGETVLIGPLKVDQWEKVRSVSFLVDPDRLSALMTLARYWSGEPDIVIAPFSSGCGMLWRELENSGRDCAVIGGTDFAMRKYIPPEIMTISVSPARFEKMLTFPDDCFLYKSWWNELMETRKRTKQT